MKLLPKSRGQMQKEGTLPLARPQGEKAPLFRSLVIRLVVPRIKTPRV
jgi:hypothetical protein